MKAKTQLKAGQEATNRVRNVLMGDVFWLN